MLTYILRVLLGKYWEKKFLESVTGKDGELSSRKTAAYYLLMLYGIGHVAYIYIMFQVESTAMVEMAKYNLYLMIVDMLGAFLYLGVVTAQNIIMGIKQVNISKGESPESEGIHKKKPSDDELG